MKKINFSKLSYQWLKFSPYVEMGLESKSIKMQTYTTTFLGKDVVVTDDGRDLFSWDKKEELLIH